MPIPDISDDAEPRTATRRRRRPRFMDFVNRGVGNLARRRAAQLRRRG